MNFRIFFFCMLVSYAAASTSTEVEETSQVNEIIVEENIETSSEETSLIDNGSLFDGDEMILDDEADAENSDVNERKGFLGKIKGMGVKAKNYVLPKKNGNRRQNTISKPSSARSNYRQHSSRDHVPKKNNQHPRYPASPSKNKHNPTKRQGHHLSKTNTHSKDLHHFPKEKIIHNSNIMLSESFNLNHLSQLASSKEKFSVKGVFQDAFKSAVVDGASKLATETVGLGFAGINKVVIPKLQQIVCHNCADEDDFIEDEPVEEESVAEDSVADESLKDEPVKDKSIKDKSVKDKSVKDKSVKDKSDKDDKKSLEPKKE